MQSSYMLKAQANQIIRSSNPKPTHVAAVFLAISVVFGLLSTYLIGSGMSYNDLMQINQHLENGNLDYAIRYMSDYMPSAASHGIDLLIQIVMSIVSVGFMMFLLNTIRRNEPCFGNLLDGFGMPFRIVLMNILIYLFVVLWSMLLLIPGIIASYRYRMSTYLLIDHPEYSPADCIRESKRLMKGHKWELFCLDLSFIGWALLGGIPMLGWLIRIWTTPYMGLTYALFYEQLSGKNASHDSSHGSYDYHYSTAEDQDSQWR